MRIGKDIYTVIGNERIKFFAFIGLWVAIIKGFFFAVSLAI